MSSWLIFLDEREIIFFAVPRKGKIDGKVNVSRSLKESAGIKEKEVVGVVEYKPIKKYILIQNLEYVLFLLCINIT